MKYSAFFFCIFMQVVYLQDLPPKFRLQHNVLPKSYNIKLSPFLDEDYFRGEVTILVELEHSLKNITLNSKELQISNLVLDSCMDTTGYEIIEKDELLNIFYTDQEYIDPGEHLIYINFTGPLNANSSGIFKIYAESGDKNIDSVATMFSASNARMAFPCLDDPVYRSRFTVRVVKPNETYTALSNMEKIDMFKTDEGIAVDFQATPPISPYLLCFVVTKYNYSSTIFKSSDGRIIPLRLFMRDKYMDQAPFLLDVANKALQFFEEYTNLTYPLSKLDFIELKDFTSEGMEHIGLVTLAENTISFDKTSNMSKISHQTDAAQLLVHEIAHMWFGDIVTHLWYNDLWITEGFAEYMQIKGLDHQYPKWQMVGVEAAIRHGFIYNQEVQSKNAFPVVNFPETHDEVELQFEDLIYSKGSAILTMLEMVMGPELFKLGVREYLRKFYYKMATTADFISTMQNITPNLNLWGFLETWLYQDRYPMVTVVQDNSSDSYIVQQKSFYIAPDMTSIFGHRWTIPVTYISNCNTTMQLIWLDKDADKVYIPRCKGQKWIKLNHDALGYYRVLYTEEQYSDLFNNFEELHEVDQANLIDEMFHMMFKLQISCGIPLNFLGKLKRSNSMLPIVASIRSFKKLLSDVQADCILSEKLRKYFISIFGGLYNKLTWKVNENDNYDTRIVRSSLVSMLCDEPVKYKKCFDDVKKLELEVEKIHPDVYNTFRKVLTLIKDEQNKDGNETSTIGPKKNISELPFISFNNLYVEMCAGWLKENL